MSEFARFPRERDNQGGWSMLEVTVVAMIAAIVLAVSIPTVASSIRAYNLRSAADHVAERIAAVRALAMAKNRNVTFSFNNSSGEYGFDFTGTEGDGVPDTTDSDDPSVSYYTESLPGGITATFPENAPFVVTFNSRGELPIGKTEQALVLNSDSRSMTVRVNLRGKVTVE